MNAIPMSDSTRRTVSVWRRIAVMACLIIMTTARGAAADEPASRAAAHFNRGVELAKQGDLENAASEFEAAHRVSPHPAVLYNLGQTYASLGRPVEAVMTLKRYLAEAAEVTPARRQEVMDQIAFHEKRIGKLVVSATPPDLQLSVDGRPTSIEGSAGLDVAAGSHVLMARKEGYEPATVVSSVRPRETTEVSIELQALTDSSAAWLEISCAVRDAVTYIDGKLVGRTPWNKPIRVDAGRHVLTFSRVGYEGPPTPVDVRGHVRATCQLEPSTRLVETLGARLRVSGAPRDARMTVDGKPYRGQLLPPGHHRLQVDSPGYQSWSAALSLPSGRTTVVDVVLAPTPAQRRLMADEARAKRRTFAYVGGGIGAVLCGLAGVMYAVNVESYRAYSADSERLSRDLSRDAASPTELNRVGSLASRAAAIERMDYLALTTGLAGVALLGSSVALYFSAEASEPLMTSTRVVGVRGVVW
jgi:hypothetical protein